MTLDPSAEHILDLLRQSTAPPIQDAPDLAAARILSTRRSQAVGLEPPEGIVAQDISLMPEAPCSIRLYRPANRADELLPVLLFLHGGGWVLGDLDSHDHICRHLAMGAGCAVVAVDYRKAPEHPFPAAIDDALAAMRWLKRKGAGHKLDPDRLALCGDSAGGNLAAVASLHTDEIGLPRPRLQILAYPVCDVAAQSPSYERHATGYLLPRDGMEYFIDCYVPDRAQRADWRTSPIRSDNLAASPPTILYTAEYDVLHDEGEAFVAALQAAGVRAEHREVHGHMHGVLSFGKLLPVTADLLAEIAADIRAALA